MKAVLDRLDHLFRHRVAGQLALVARCERGVLKLVGAGADQAVTIDVAGQDQAVGIGAASDQYAFVGLQIELDLFQLSTDHSQKRVFGADDRRLTDQVPQDVEVLFQVRRVEMGLRGYRLATPGRVF